MDIREAIVSLTQKFTSSNDVPVTQATIKKGEWEALKPLLKFAEHVVAERGELKSALGTILDLASENLLDERDVEGEELKKQARMQETDMGIVSDLYHRL